ncbi:MAG TPA: GFA family protein [Acetobacteraceae bacterium]|nr:GFA family protein [Acetobacteraceae bacterium]
MSLSGGCQCGAVRYTISVEPLSVYVCHCRECRRQSASAFGISVIVPEAAFALTEGEVRTWRRPTDSGRVLDCMFCVVCGSRICHTTPDEGVVSVKGGSLDEPPGLQSATHIWTTRRLPGVVIPRGVAQYGEEPD